MILAGSLEKVTGTNTDSLESKVLALQWLLVKARVDEFFAHSLLHSSFHELSMQCQIRTLFSKDGEPSVLGGSTGTG